MKNVLFAILPILTSSVAIAVPWNPELLSAANVKMQGRDFAAPIVSSSGSLPGDTPFGSIIFDNAAGTFKGLAADGNWQSFGSTGANTSLSNLSSTAINADLLSASNNTINIGGTGNEFSTIHARDAYFDNGSISIGSTKFGFSAVSAESFYGPTSAKGLIFKATSSSPDTYLYSADGSNLVLAPVSGGVVVFPTHLRSSGDVYSPTPPSANPTANAGSTGTCTIANATDVAGQITVTPSGSGIAAGDVCVVSFGQTFVTAPICSLTPANSDAAVNAPQVFVTRATTDFTLNFVNAGSSATSYVYNFFCIETQ